MRKPAALIIAVFIFSLVNACTKAPDSEASTPVNKPDATASTSPRPSSTPDTVPAPSELAGNYSVTGESPTGIEYTGDLQIVKRDEVYQLSWTLANAKYDGIGVRSGNTIAAAYTTGTDGKGCGAVIYKVNTDDSIEGRWGEWGVNSAGTEKAVPSGAVTGSIGNFDVTGTNGNGTGYKGKLKVTRSSDDVYQLSWDVGAKYIGTGVKMGEYLAAGSGSKQCGFVIYELRDGKLDGRWGVPGTTKLGTETAKKK